MLWEDNYDFMFSGLSSFTAVMCLYVEFYVLCMQRFQ